jgi:hypothetical protein
MVDVGVMGGWRVALAVPKAQASKLASLDRIIPEMATALLANGAVPSKVLLTFRATEQ